MAVELEEHVGLELRFGAGDLLVADFVRAADEIVKSVPHEVIKLVVRGDSVDAEEASVLVAGVESHVAVSKLSFGDCLAKLGGSVLAGAVHAVPGAKDSLQDHQ